MERRSSRDSKKVGGKGREQAPVGDVAQRAKGKQKPGLENLKHAQISDADVVPVLSDRIRNEDFRVEFKQLRLNVIDISADGTTVTVNLMPSGNVEVDLGEDGDCIGDEESGETVELRRISREISPKKGNGFIARYSGKDADDTELRIEVSYSGKGVIQALRVLNNDDSDEV